MYNTPNLETLEKRAFRATQQDGLWDIYIGLIVLSMSMLAYSDETEAFPVLRFGLFLGGLGLAFLIYWAGRKYLTTPRLGQVKFGPHRQKRKQILTIVLSAIVLLQVLLLVGTIILWQNPHQAAILGLGSNNFDRERFLVAMVGVLFVGPSTALIAYFNDFLRGYYISCVLSLAVFSLIWFGQPMYLIFAGMFILVPGVFLLVRFLYQYKLPPDEALNE